MQKQKQFLTYGNYKYSGIEWFGEIPEHWEVRKVKGIGEAKAGGTPSTNEPEYWNGNIPWLPSGKIQNNILTEKDAENFITLEGLNNSATKYIRANSVLVALTGATCGNIALLKFKSTANQSVVGIENNLLISSSRYLFYLLLSQKEQILINQSGGAQSGINLNDVKNIFTTLPPKQEQEEIANYLDKKTEQINNLIQKNQKLIELQQERKTALINDIVTKGLNKNVEFKDSGIGWLGEIPKHWEIRRCRSIFNYQKGKKPTEFLEEKEKDSQIYLSMDYLRDKKDIQIFFSKNEYGLTYVQENNLLLLWDGSNAGEFILGRQGILSSTMVKINPIINIDSNYLFYLSNIIEKILKKNTIGMGIPHVSGNELKNILVPYVRDIKEQEEIVQYLDKETQRIDQIVEKINKEINLLREYKESLINNVVTGKVKVSN